MQDADSPVEMQVAKVLTERFTLLVGTGDRLGGVVEPYLREQPAPVELDDAPAAFALSAVE